MQATGFPSGKLYPILSPPPAGGLADQGARGHRLSDRGPARTAHVPDRRVRHPRSSGRSRRHQRSDLPANQLSASAAWGANVNPLYVFGGALTFLGGLAMAWISNVATEEATTRIERLPHAILCLAVRRLPHGQRTECLEEWSAELALIAGKTSGMPITRIVKRLNYAIGAIWSAKRICPSSSRSEVAPQPSIPHNIVQIHHSHGTITFLGH